jgi:hypothetical protein
MVELSGRIEVMRTTAADAAVAAASASGTAARQTGSIDGLAATSVQLAELADRLRQSISHFQAAESASGTTAPALQGAGSPSVAA